MAGHATPTGFPRVSNVVTRLVIIGATLLALALAAAPATRAASLTPPPPAGADCRANPSGTVCSWTETFATPFPVPYGVTCDGFSVRVNLSGERQIIAFYDSDGALDRRIRHGTFSGTLINSISGASVPHEGHFTIFDDIAAGTSTITGMLSRTVLPGDGLVWRNIGRIVLSLQSGAVLFDAGEHGTWEVLNDPAIAAELCSALG